MAAENEAILTLKLQAEQFKAEIAVATQRYAEGINKLALLTAAGVSPTSAQFQKLQREVLKSGQDLLLVSQQGLGAMNVLAASTGKPIAEVEVLQREIVELTAQVNTLQREGGRGFDLVGKNVDTLGKKFTNLSKGLLAGFALGPVVGVISLLTEALGKAIAKLQEFTIRQIAGDEAGVKLGARTKLLNDSLNALAAQQEKATHAQALALAQASPYAVSVDKVRAAVEAHNIAIDAASVEYAQNTAEGASLEQRRLAIYTRTIALKTAEEAYAKAIRETTLAVRDKDRGDRIQSLADQLTGDEAALRKQADALVTVITKLQETGNVTQEVKVKIIEALTEEQAKYKEFGLKAPADLQLLIDKYLGLEEAQKRAQDSANAYFDRVLEGVKAQQAAEAAANKPAQQREGDASKRVETIRNEVAALEEQQEAGNTTLEQSERLAEKKIELKKAEQDLNRATLEGAKGLDTYGDAAKIAEARIQETINQLRLAHGEINEFGEDLTAQNQSLVDAAKYHGELRGGIDEVTAATVEWANASVDNAKSLADAEAAAAKLADEQERGADASKDAASGIEGTAKAVERLKEAKPDEVVKALGDELATAQTNGSGLNGELQTTLDLIGQIKAELAGVSIPA